MFPTFSLQASMLGGGFIWKLLATPWDQLAQSLPAFYTLTQANVHRNQSWIYGLPHLWSALIIHSVPPAMFTWSSNPRDKAHCHQGLQKGGGCGAACRGHMQWHNWLLSASQVSNSNSDCKPLFWILRVCCCIHACGGAAAKVLCG